MQLEIPECRRCCCFIPLRYGIIVFGYLNLNIFRNEILLKDSDSFYIIIAVYVLLATNLPRVIYLCLFLGFMIFSLLTLGEEIWLETGDMNIEHTMTLYRGALFITQTWLPIILYLLEAIFDVVLLVGAHLKNPRLLRVYYYYGITTTSAIALVVLFLMVRHYEALQDWNTVLFEGVFIFCGFALQIYLLLLIRTELKKLKQKTQLSFINYVAEVVVLAPQGGEGRNPF